MTQENETQNISVPWTGWDVLLFLILWFIAQTACGIFAYVAPPSPPLGTTAEVEKKDHGHAIVQLIEKGKDLPIVLLVAFLAVVVAAPVAEELLFRLFFQGWLETKLRPSYAIVVVSLFFALIHAGNSGAHDGLMLFYMFGAVIVANLLIFSLGITYLVRIRKIKASHCLFGTGRFFHTQFFAYAGCCLLALLPIFGVSALMDVLCPNTNMNPIPIFLFSLVLGFLYNRTRNLSYCILLHACLNATSLAIVWFSV